jgi:3-hydroxybutyryl-CoA dehydratase
MNQEASTLQGRPRGYYFEEFEEGVELVTPARTITETDIQLFAGLTGDYNQLHTDVEFCKDTIFGQPVAHGLLGLSIASGLGTRLGFIEGTAVALREMTWKFTGPIFIGDTIHLKVKVAHKKAMPRLGMGMVTFDVVLVNQKDETVQKGQWKALIQSEEAEVSPLLRQESGE